MAHIFISYSSRQRSITADFTSALKAEGYDVWWDRALEAWGDYEEQIREALQDAAAVVVIWSEGAADSDWVKAEAERARTSRKLVNLRAPGFPLDEIPSPFNRMDHILTLDPDDLAPVLKSVHTVWRGEVPAGVKARHISYREQYCVDLFSPKRAPMPEDLRDLSPSALLQARYEIVPFVDTTDHCADMLDWCRNTGAYADEPRATAGRLLHGPGGLGKTRLMIEISQKLRYEGWLAGFMEPPKRPGDEVEAADREQALRQALSGGDEPGVLMVLDYAEARQAEVLELARLARSRPREGVRPVRVVLLARGEVWWQELYRREVEVEILFQRRGHRFGDVAELTQPAPGEARLALFDATVEAYRPLIAEMAGAGIVPPPAEPRQTPARRKRVAEEPGFARPLALQMEALLTLYGASRDAGGLEILLEDILGLERRHWSRVIEGLSGDAGHEEALRRGVAQITAVGGTEKRRQAEDLMAADGHFGARAPAEVPWRELHRLYGRPGRDGGVGALEPDLLGEHEAALSGDDRLVEACLKWISGLPEAEQTPRRRALVTVLQRASRPEHGATGEDAADMLRHIIKTAGPALMPDLVAVAAETPGQLADLLNKAVPELAAETFDALVSALPKETVALADLGEASAARRLAQAQTAVESEESNERIADLAHAQQEYGKRLHSLGRHNEAFDAIEQAVLIYRRLAEAQPNSFQEGLALALSDLAEAVTRRPFDSIDRNLIANNVFTRRRDMRRNLVSKIKLGKGKVGMALPAIEEAVTIQERLSTDRGGEYRVDLAESLIRFGKELYTHHRHKEAVAATKKAATILVEILATKSPNELEALLAESLTNLGPQFHDIGKEGEAIESAKAAAEIYRRLAIFRPDAFEPLLANSLFHLWVVAASLGNHEVAIYTMEEEVAVLRGLAEQRPDIFEPQLANSLFTLNIGYEYLGNQNKAVVVKEEEVKVRRRREAARSGPSAGLAASLGELSSLLWELKSWEKSLHAKQEQVEVYRQVTKRNDSFGKQLARSLHELGFKHALMGRRTSALVAEQEAVETLRRLAEACPNDFDNFEYYLATGLHELAERFSRCNRADEAVAAEKEAVAIHRRMAEASPNDNYVETLLFIGLKNLVERFLQYNRAEEAVAAAEEGFALLTSSRAIHPAGCERKMGTMQAILAKAKAARDLKR